jgi:dolichol-phosphate mannosyltransferase
MPAVVIVPTYNEADNVANLIDCILALPHGLHVIVVDDNSPDGTGDLVDALAKLDRRVVLLRRPAKLGLGSAHLAGFQAAWDRGFDPILTMDADFSHHPSYIPQLLASSDHADLVIGSRYTPGGGTRRCTLFRRALSRLANGLACAALGLRATDCTAGFRCYRRALVGHLLQTPIAANGYSFLIEVLYRVQRHGFGVSEVPILFEDRRFGISKISKHEIYKAGATVLRLLVSRARREQPNPIAQ